MDRSSSGQDVNEGRGRGKGGDGGGEGAGLFIRQKAERRIHMISQERGVNRCSLVRHRQTHTHTHDRTVCGFLD